jgi:hypothetical protein
VQRFLRITRRISVEGFKNGVLREMFWSEMLEETDAGENFIIRSFMICMITKYYMGEQLKADKLSGVCNPNGGEEIRTRIW